MNWLEKIYNINLSIKISAFKGYKRPLNCKYEKNTHPLKARKMSLEKKKENLGSDFYGKGFSLVSLSRTIFYFIIFVILHRTTLFCHFLFVGK